jgi:hypothetical protein
MSKHAPGQRAADITDKACDDYVQGPSMPYCARCGFRIDLHPAKEI